MVTVDHFLREHAALLSEKLKNLISNHRLLADDKRMEQSAEIFNQLRIFFDGHQRLVRKALNQDESLHKAIEVYEAEQAEIWDIYEHTINIHVDEPYDEYLKQLERIQQHFQTFTTLEYGRLLDRMVSNLSNDEREGLVSAIQKDPEVVGSRF